MIPTIASLAEKYITRVCPVCKTGQTCDFHNGWFQGAKDVLGEFVGVEGRKRAYEEFYALPEGSLDLSPRRSKPPVTAIERRARKELMHELHKIGYTIPEISNMLNCDPSTVRYHLPVPVGPKEAIMAPVAQDTTPPVVAADSKDGMQLVATGQRFTKDDLNRLGV